VAALIDSAEIAAVRAGRATLLVVLDEIELCEAALLSMAVDALDLSANCLCADTFRVSIGEDTPAAIRWGRGPEHG
jgi:hypothetical protein